MVLNYSNNFEEDHLTFIPITLFWNLSIGFYPLYLIQQFCRATLNLFCQKIENLYNCMDNLCLKMKTLCQKEKLLVLSNFFFCHYVFKKLSAAEASESIYMRERVNPLPHTNNLQQMTLETSRQKPERLFKIRYIY